MRTVVFYLYLNFCCSGWGLGAAVLYWGCCIGNAIQKISGQIELSELNQTGGVVPRVGGHCAVPPPTAPGGSANEIQLSLPARATHPPPDVKPLALPARPASDSPPGRTRGGGGFLAVAQPPAGVHACINSCGWCMCACGCVSSVRGPDRLAPFISSQRSANIPFSPTGLSTKILKPLLLLFWGLLSPILLQKFQLKAVCFCLDLGTRHVQRGSRLCMWI